MPRALLIALLLPATAFAQDVFWSYDGDQDGQEKWGMLTHTFAACELGKQQSPVNIAYTKLSYKPPIEFHYQPVEGSAHYDGRLATITVQGGASLSSEAVEYTLKSIEFHSPSEHEVQGNFYALEIQMLHEDKDGNKLMLSVFGDMMEKATNPAIATLFKGTNLTSGKEAQVRFNPEELLPDDRHYYAYTGSLTHPPCTEGIEWRILKKPIVFSKEQLRTVTMVIGRNARLTQPIYMRGIEETGR